MKADKKTMAMRRNTHDIPDFLEAPFEAPRVKVRWKPECA